MGDVRDPERDQPLPVPNDGPSMHDLVAADMMERKEHGLRKYGQLLQAFNGRSFLQDGYEEVLDLAVYLRGALEEERARDVRTNPAYSLAFVHERERALLQVNTELTPQACRDLASSLLWFADRTDKERARQQRG